jgi:hypothetical protein
MDRWDVLWVCVAGYVAVTTLVRLMARRRNELVDEIRGEIEASRRRREAEEAEQDAA